MSQRRAHSELSEVPLVKTQPVLYEGDREWTAVVSPSRRLRRLCWRMWLDRGRARQPVRRIGLTESCAHPEDPDKR